MQRYPTIEITHQQQIMHWLQTTQIRCIQQLTMSETYQRYADHFGAQAVNRVIFSRFLHTQLIGRWSIRVAGRIVKAYDARANPTLKYIAWPEPKPRIKCPTCGKRGYLPPESPSNP